MLGTFEVTLSDGATRTVKPILADAVAYETTARNRGWGGLEDSTSKFTASAFLIWKALTRTGEYAGTFEEFLGEDISLQGGSEGEGLDPTEGLHA
ncbi:hypothetical protein ACUY2G_04880 [Corynebacterium guaraldiae]